MTLDGAPSWQQRLDARQSPWLLAFYVVFVLYWVWQTIATLSEPGREAWWALIPLLAVVAFTWLVARLSWSRFRVRRWDQDNPGQAPLGPTPEEAARARRSRLAGYAAAGAIAVAAVVVAVLADSWDIRGPLLIVTGVTIVFVLVDASRSERPAETVVQLYPGPGEVDPSRPV